MKLSRIALTASAGLAAAGAWAGQAENRERTLTVYLSGEGLVPIAIRARGEDIAARMFAAIGVRIDWHHGQPQAGQAQREQAVVVRFLDAPSAQVTPNALAAAFPYEGSVVTVFYSRMKWAEQLPMRAPSLFGHVLAHEIAHNLQGLDRHSATGLMKARWTEADFNSMRAKPLSFEPEDIIWINGGLDARAARAAAVR